jgi:hypothetical protein
VELDSASMVIGNVDAKNVVLVIVSIIGSNNVVKNAELGSVRMEE